MSKICTRSESHARQNPPPVLPSSASPRLPPAPVPDPFQTEVLDKSAEKPVLVDFWAPWCGPCRTLSPTLDALAKESGGRWRLVKINTDAHPALAQRFGVRGIPSVKLFVDGAVAAEFTGALPETEVRRWLAEHVPA